MQSTSIIMRKRITVLFFFAAFLLFILVSRLAYIQFVQGDQLRQDALENRTRDIPVEAKRGSIFDRKGNELVTSVSVDSVFAIPSQVTKPDEAAAKIAVVLDLDVDKVHKQITQKQSFVWIKRKVDYQQAQELKALKLEGIGFVEESKRYYLKGDLAAHVLGFVGVDNQGLTGIENTFENDLSGTAGRIVVERDAAGREISNAVHNYFPPVQGHNLVLTIDETVQYFVERELDKLIDKFQPKGAVVTVMDPRTGEILAMGNRPTFDPNHWSAAPQSTWDRNAAIWYNYEPGSTFKIIILSAALEEMTVNKNDRFYDPGYVKVADRNIRCWKAGGHGSQSFEEVIQNSCNPGFIKIGLNVGIPDFYKYVRGFGFGTPTGVILPGEAQGITIPEKKATTLNLATMSIGQSIAVTPLQLLTAVSASINGGLLMEPMLVKAVTDADGKVVHEYQPKSVRRVVSEETSREVASLLEGVVLYGSGRNAYVDGYRVGGKTGTAQVVGSSGGYVSGRYVSSFIGFAPVEDPQVAILVTVIEPQGGVYFGSQVAAPTFRAVMQDTLQYLGVPEQKDLPKPKNLNFWENTREPEEVRVPQVVNVPVNQAVQDLRGIGLNFMIRGEGPVVYGQIPEAGATVLEGTTVILELKTGPEEESAAQVTVPDLAGLTIKQVGGLLENMGLRLEPVGTGFASRQKPGPGEKVDRGAFVRVEFEPTAERQGPTD